MQSVLLGGIARTSNSTFFSGMSLPTNSASTEISVGAIESINEISTPFGTSDTLFLKCSRSSFVVVETATTSSAIIRAALSVSLPKNPSLPKYSYQ